MKIPRKTQRMLLLFIVGCFCLYLTVHQLEISTKQLHTIHVNRTQTERNLITIDSTVQSIMVERKEQMNQACLNEHFSERQPKLKSFDKRLIYREKQNVLYCQIPKVGSTTIKKILHYMNVGRKSDSPFEIPLSSVDLHMGYPKVKQLSDLKKYNTSLKFLFVRDPYYRLFSGFADKLFMTNTYYWNTLGRSIIKRFRKNPSEKSQACGHDVNFSEVVKYLTSGNGPLEWHFEPMHRQCRPCAVTYDIIGKVESFNQDIKYIWKAINKKTGLTMPFPDVEESAEKGEIKEKIKWLFEGKSEITKCMTFFQAMKRTWRTLQVRGAIARNVTMPFLESDAENVTLETYQEALYVAYKGSGSKAYRKQCKQEAMVEAYRSVPMEDLLLLQQMFAPDCELFGYNKQPAHIFNRSLATTSYVYFNKM